MAHLFCWMAKIRHVLFALTVFATMQFLQQPISSGPRGWGVTAALVVAYALGLLAGRGFGEG